MVVRDGNKISLRAILEVLGNVISGEYDVIATLGE
jgi:hypothetical protein